MTMAPRRLMVVGLAHQDTPLDVRERFTLPEECVPAFVASLRQAGHSAETVVLNTCNRTEIYTSADLALQPDNVLDLLAHLRGQSADELRQHGFARFQSDMVAHLFRVASGLESQMLGETEILGQTKRALESARTIGSVRGEMATIFERAFQCAKWVRSHTGIGFGQTSVGSVAVELATRIFGPLEQCRILVIGSGEVAERVLQNLQSRGARDFTVSGRSFERASNLARLFGGAALPWENLDSHLADFDIVLASTAAPEPILTAARAETVRGARGFNPWFLVDLAVPRNIEPAAGDLEQVFLYDLDDLGRIAGENRKAREGEIATCEEEIQRRAWRTWLRYFRRNPFPAAESGLQRSLGPETASSES